MGHRQGQTVSRFLKRHPLWGLAPASSTSQGPGGGTGFSKESHFICRQSLPWQPWRECYVPSQTFLEHKVGATEWRNPKRPEIRQDFWWGSHPERAGAVPGDWQTCVTLFNLPLTKGTELLGNNSSQGCEKGRLQPHLASSASWVPHSLGAPKCQRAPELGP